MTKRTYEIEIWEKAEHWTFTAKLDAADDDSAWRMAQKEYPSRAYSIRSVRQVYNNR